MKFDKALSMAHQGNWNPKMFEAKITEPNGKVIFEQKEISAPGNWSEQAVNIVASRYFRGPEGGREDSVFKMVDRVVDTITDWGIEGGYFDSNGDIGFNEELRAIILGQYATFNSPVWFNVGFEEKPQCSACFILKVEDDMESIYDWVATEGKIFQGGSGAGINLSPLRGSMEELSKGGLASGPLSFMKIADAGAGVVKSGGKTRRAAKMVILDWDHPDIFDFVNCKADEEWKAKALIKAGYDSSIAGPAYGNAWYQNANNSVRVSDEFMKAVEDNKCLHTVKRVTGEDYMNFSAKDLFHNIASAAWECGDPGLQFDSTIQKWHTCPKAGRISASNPCSEYMHLDNSACNLASINLMKFWIPEQKRFNIHLFKHVVRIMITAMDILVDNSSYPTPQIAANTKKYRQLGLGFANLGALLMSIGLPYDSDEARSLAGGITSLMSAQAYYTSTELARELKPFEGMYLDCAAMGSVLGMHKHFAMFSDRTSYSEAIYETSVDIWKQTIEQFKYSGIRNAQATVLAPTGTIAFMMDCDTTGIEPDIALVKYKKLAGGGTIKIVNKTVKAALDNLNYGDNIVNLILEYIERNDTIENCMYITNGDLPIFDCAFKPANGERSIPWEAHVKMVAAVQPFISGAVSKTVNMPADSTIEDIEKAYMMAWEMGLKAVAVYRDGCKETQPLNTSKEADEPKETRVTIDWLPQKRQKLDNTREAITHKFDICGHEGYITVGLYEDGRPGEIFVRMNKTGSTISGLIDAFATAVSFGLQYGVPLEFLIDKFKHQQFEPRGFTKNPEIPQVTSIVDYLFKWLEKEFIEQPFKQFKDPVTDFSEIPEIKNQENLENQRAPAARYTGNLCVRCGVPMQASGTCHVCPCCGETSGCS